MLYRRCFATVSPSCHSCHLMKISLEKKSIGDITVPERKITKLLSLLKQVVQLVLRRRLVYGILCLLLVSVMIFLSGPMPDTLDEEMIAEDKHRKRGAMLARNESEIAKEVGSNRKEMAYHQPGKDHARPETTEQEEEIKPVTLSSSKEFDLRSCTENEKLFRGTFHQNVRKIKNLKFPEADEWIEKLGLNKNVSREVASFPVFVTAATSGYFDISQGVIKSVHEKLMPKYPNLKLIYYGLDLQDSQLSRMKRHCKCEVRKFPPKEVLPPHARHWKIYTFKAIIVATLFQEFGHVWWVDSSIRFITDDLTGPLEYIKQNGSLFFTYDKSMSTAMHTRIGTFNYFGENPCPYGEFGEIESGNVAFYENDLTRAIIRNWVSCALIENCQAPPGHNLSCRRITTQVGQCHRYDQSVLGIMMRRLYHEQNDYPATKTPWRIIKVMRGNKVNYLPP